jgi:hypothetical protein
MRVYRKFLMRSAALGAAVLLALTLGARAQDSASPHDKIAVWGGHWKVRIETKETQFGHAKTADFDSKCSFLPDGAFMVCDYLSLQPDPNSGHVIDDVSLVYYSDVDKTFKYTNLAPEGGPNENTMTVDGNVWTRPFEITRRSGEVVQARQIYILTRDKHAGRLEISPDKGANWIVVNESVGTKER